MVPGSMSNPSELLGGRLGAICLALSLTATLACPAEEEEGDEEVGMDETDAETTDTNTTDTTETDTMTALSHAADIQPIWDARCTSACHEPGGAVGAVLDLSGDAYDNIVDVNSPTVVGAKLIAPGDTAASYLVAKIEDTHIAFGGSGSKMPPAGQTELTAAEIQTIKDWVTAGAMP